MESRLPHRCDVLDFGCGSGLIAHRLRQQDHSVIAVDPSETMLNRARARGVAVEYLVASSVPPGRRFESAVVVNVLHVLREYEPMLDNLIRATDEVVVLVWPEDGVTLVDLMRWELDGGMGLGRVIRGAILRVMVGIPGVVLNIRRNSNRALRVAVDAVAIRYSREVEVTVISGTGCIMTTLATPHLKKEAGR